MIRLVCRDSSIGGVESKNIDCSEPQRNVFNHAHRRVTCVLPCKGPEACADTATIRGQNGCRRWESGIDEEEHVRNEGKQWGTELGISTRTQFEESVSSQRKSSVGLDTRDDFVLTGPTKKLMEFERKMTSVYPIQAKIISYGSPKNIKTLNRRLHW